MDAGTARQATPARIMLKLIDTKFVCIPNTALMYRDTISNKYKYKSRKGSKVTLPQRFVNNEL